MPRRCVDPLSSPRRRRPGLGLAGLSLLLVGLGFGGCAQRPQDVAVASHGREYFPSSVYGPASRRVVADGQPVPHGGGQYLVGKPYTIAGRTYYPSETHRTQVGNASWYGDAFHGRLTANGEIYDRDGFTAASPIMPLPSYARVTNLRNNYSMIVRVNDRGPYASDRIMDVSRRVAEALDFKRYGTARLKVEYVGRASLAGSDDARLYATLKTDGPATWQGDPTMVAEVAPRAQVASLAPYVPEPPPQVRRAPPPPRVVEAHPREPDVIGEVVERRRSRERIEVATEPTLHWQHGPAPARRDVAYGERPMHGWAPPPAPWHARLASVETAPPMRPHAGRLVEPPPSRVADRAARHPALPPSRPIDLGTIPGAGSQIRARHEPVRLRMARARDD